MTRDIEDIVAQTEALRSDDGAMWSRIRELLVQRGVDPATSAVLEFFPDDVSFYYGIVVTADGHLFQFGFDYLHKSEATGDFTEWNDCSSNPPVVCSRAGIEAAFQVARGVKGAR